MSDWFSFWGEKHPSDTSSFGNTLNTAADVKKAIAGITIAKSAVGAVQGLTSLANIPLYKKERDNAIKSIENNVLAGQDAIIRELSYNTDQALVYAARGNVSIGAPVIRERMKKGAQEAGFDFAMLEANAKIQKENARIQYAQKRRKSFDAALSGILNLGLTVGAMGAFGGASSVATDPMQVASANNLL
jgi:hypothetical protein